ncbi:MAG: glycosyltransferase family 39 protein [Kiritimatiellia bacterium]|jgi:hypothetical protein|nr:glycosyltransferase family 39 protein [Kiritimatiellia bacterium]
MDIETRRRRSRRIQTVVLALTIVGIHLGLLVYARPGFLGSDDLSYARAMGRIVDGSFHVQPSQFDNRFGLLFPTALCVRWFGMNPWSAVLWPMLCSCATVLLVFCWTTSRYGRTAGILAGILMATCNLQIHWALYMMPDVVLATMLFAALLCVESARTSTGPGSRWGWAAAFGVAMFCAICTKLTAIWIAPFLALSLGIDLVRRKAWKPWLSIAVAGTASAAAYLIMYWALTGDPLFRIHWVEEVFATGSLPDSFEYSRAAYIQRLVYQPFHLIWSDRMFRRLCILTLCMLAGLRPRERQDQSGGGVRQGLYALTFCLVFWFGSISLSRYRPIDPLGRYLLPMIPPMTVCTGILLATIAAKPDTHPGILRPFRKLLRIRHVGLALASLLILRQGVSLFYALSNGLIGETESTAIYRRFVADHLDQRDIPAVVYTDQRSAEVFDVFFGIGGRHAASVKGFSEYNHEDATDAAQYLYVNRGTLAILKNIYNISLEDDIARILNSGSWKPVTATPRAEIYQRVD